MPKTPIQAAAVQMTSTADVERNVDTALQLTRAAAHAGADLVVLPECFFYLGPEEGKLDVAEPLPGGGPVLDRCRNAARDAGVELVLGGFWERGDDARKVRNACVHLDEQGEIRAIYRKIHLFDVDLADGTTLSESDTVEPGSECVTSDSRVGMLGLSVCYDLRFPELYRRLVDQDATVIVVPSAFTRTTGRDHWHVLLRARAIESQCHVVAAAQAGHHYGRRQSYGHALVVDPWGRILAEEPDEAPGFVIAEIDPEVTANVRRQVPSLAHRRLTL